MQDELTTKSWKPPCTSLKKSLHREQYGIHLFSVRFWSAFGETPCLRKRYKMLDFGTDFNWDKQAANCELPLFQSWKFLIIGHCFVTLVQKLLLKTQEYRDRT